MIHFGFYCDIGRLAYPSRIADYYREMASRGMTTATIEGGAASLCPSHKLSAIAANVELLLENGLARPGEPLLFYGNPVDTYGAMQASKRLPWPTPIHAVGDDSNPTQIPWIEAATYQVHNQFFRSATTTGGYYVKENKVRDTEGEPPKTIGDVVDCWIIHAPTWQQDTLKNARALHKELWTYYTCPSTEDYERMRYLGLWAWAHRPEQVLVWAYTHVATTLVRADGSLSVDPGDRNSYAIPRHDGTVHSTSGYDGYADGIQDCRALEAAEASMNPDVIEYLEIARKFVPFAMPRSGRPLPDEKWRGPAVVAHLNALLERHEPINAPNPGDQ